MKQVEEETPMVPLHLPHIIRHDNLIVKTLVKIFLSCRPLSRIPHLKL
jgi:hypothetical protein